MSQRDREIIIAILAAPHENNLGPPPPPPPIMPNNQLPVPNVAMPSMQPQNNSADVLRHAYLQAVMQQKQNLRVSPLPNGE